MMKKSTFILTVSLLAAFAAAGHPAPFNLQYLGVGNEDHITPVFEERFSRSISVNTPRMNPIANTWRTALAEAACLTSLERNGDVVLKLVNLGAGTQSLPVGLSGAKKIARNATKTVLTGKITAVNAFGRPAAIVPQTSSLTAGEAFDFEAPAHSLTVIRLTPR